MKSVASTISMEDQFLLPTYSKRPVSLVRGEGSLVWDEAGTRYIDFYGGHCVLPLGHCPPPVVEAIKRQSEELIFYSNLVYNPPRADTAQLIASLCPDPLNSVFFCNSGTEANETALKLAIQYTGRPIVAAMEGGFHGRTLGSLSVTHGESYRAPYKDVLPASEFIPFGDVEAAVNRLRGRDDVAAVILEPIQSMAGVVEAPTEFFEALRRICDEHGMLLIFDEIQTGVGRTGTFSFSSQLGVTPDIVTMAKSLGSGVPIGAVVVSDAIASSVEPGDHGSTFGGGMMAVAAAAATVSTIVDRNLMERATRIFEFVKSELEDHVVSVKGKGCLIGLELEKASPIVAELLNRGVLVGGSSHPKTIRLMPPLNCPEPTLSEGLSILREVLNQEENELLGNANPV